MSLAIVTLIILTESCIFEADPKHLFMCTQHRLRESLYSQPFCICFSEIDFNPVAPISGLETRQLPTERRRRAVAGLVAAAPAGRTEPSFPTPQLPSPCWSVSTYFSIFLFPSLLIFLLTVVLLHQTQLVSPPIHFAYSIASPLLIHRCTRSVHSTLAALLPSFRASLHFKLGPYCPEPPRGSIKRTFSSLLLISPSPSSFLFMPRHLFSRPSSQHFFLFLHRLPSALSSPFDRHTSQS